MEKTKSRRRKRAEKPPLSVTGPLVMPSEILPWERNLLAVFLESVEGSEKGEQESEIEVTS